MDDLASLSRALPPASGAASSDSLEDIRAELLAKAGPGNSLLIGSPADVELFKGAVASSRPEPIAFDCEGVSLSRAPLSSLTLVTFAVPLPPAGPSAEKKIVTFHFDTMRRDAGELAALKEVLENPAIIKVIHDVRQDSDALQVKLGITVRGTQDLQVLDVVGRYRSVVPLSRVNSERPTLSDVLGGCGVAPAPKLDTSNYEAFPPYWERRPLTAAQLGYARGDVAGLLSAHVVLLSRIPDSVKSSRALADLHAENEGHVRACIFWEAVPNNRPRDKGELVGRGGSNLARIERESGALRVCPDRRPESPARTTHWVLVQATSQASLDAAKRLLAPYV